MSSSLNEILIRKIRSLLQKEPTSGSSNRDELVSLADWNTMLVDQVTDELLALPPTEQSIHDLYYWGRFIFARMKEINKGATVERLYGLVHAIDLMFKYLSRPTVIPFKYWSDIAPHLVGEVRRFRAQTKSYEEFYRQDMQGKLLDDKDKWLAETPETAELYERWDHENMFG
jgi:hypothetical protein